MNGNNSFGIVHGHWTIRASSSFNSCAYRHLISHNNFIAILSFNPHYLTLLCTVHFAIELSDLSKPFKFARLKSFERLENCLTKGTYERF